MAAGPRTGRCGQARGLDGLGGVFSDVVRYRLGRQRRPGAGQSAGRADYPGVDLCPESKNTPQAGAVATMAYGRRCRRLASSADGWCRGDGSGGLADGLGEQRGGVAGRGGWQSSPGASRRMMAWKWTTPRAWNSATLTNRTRDLLAQGLLGEAGQAGQLAGQVDGEPAPQFGGVGVEQDVPGVVVAVRAQRLAERGSSGRWVRGQESPGRAGSGVAGVAAGAAGQLAAAAAGAGGVDRAEAGRGEGGEDARVGGDGARGFLCRRSARRG